MKAQCLAGRGLRAAVGAAACLLWALAGPRTSWALSGGEADTPCATGERWQVVAPPPTPGRLAALAWTGTTLVAVGSAGTILTSPDGAVWTTRASGTTADLTAVAWIGDQVVAVGDGDTVLTSPDGVTWTRQPPGPPRPFDGEPVASTRTVAIGEGDTVLIGSYLPPRSAPSLATPPEGRPATAGDSVRNGSRLRRHVWRLEPTGLVLPYEDLSELVEVRCYGVFPWDAATNETHGGLDLIARHTDLGPGATRKVGLVAPASGTIYDVRELAKAGKATAFMLTVKVNDYWFVSMVLEPQNPDPSIADEQRRSVTVQAGQAVRRGDPIGDLVVTNVHYPHVHFMIYYKDPNQTYEDFFANYLLIPRNQGDDLPPTSGPGSPWAPEDLRIPSTLFCPYVYSERLSRARIDQILKQSYDGTVCRCVCAYGSRNADCGACSP